MDRVKALAPQHPEKEEKEPFAPLRWERRRDGINGGDTHTGMTTEEFSQIVRDWIATARNPKTGRPYNEMIYPPMVELLGYRRKGFKTFIVSGGGVSSCGRGSRRLMPFHPSWSLAAAAS